MRTDAATWGGKADHHIVDAPAWQEAKVLQQLMDFWHELVDRLYQQGPVTFRQGAERVFFERAAAQFPRTLAVLDHQARFDFFFQGQAGQFVGIDRAFEVGKGLAYQQRFFLPVVAHEFTGCEAAQQLQWSIRIHV
ncbi:hypothetical protein D3C78_1626530 [compost metagenome]